MKRGSKTEEVNHDPQHLDLLDLNTLHHRAILPLEHSRHMRHQLSVVLGVKEHVRYENINDLGIDCEVQQTIGTFKMRRHLVDDRDHIKEGRLRSIKRL